MHYRLSHWSCVNPKLGTAIVRGRHMNVEEEDRRPKLESMLA